MKNREKWMDLYDFKFRYNYKKQDKVTWNKIIFKTCPFDVDEIKIVGEVKRQTKDFVGLVGKRGWWNWWELVPIQINKKIIYWIKFYSWYLIRYKRQQKQIDNLE